MAQIPLGIAGPLRINGEYAQGDFLIPLAATEGTLVASYNRGIKLVNLCGGVKCTVAGSAMQRAPVFVFSDARAAREFVNWVREPDNYDKIREEAEATSSVARLQYIDTFLASKFAYLRFNFSTGDAAGQNMVGRATFAACGWIIDHYSGIHHFYLESNFATDKKASNDQYHAHPRQTGNGGSRDQTRRPYPEYAGGAGKLELSQRRGQRGRADVRGE